jgi:hypothetical protein
VKAIIALSLTAIFVAASTDNLSAQAADNSPSKTMITIESLSCAAWANERRRRTIKYYQNDAWAVGFLSGWVMTQQTARDPLLAVDGPAVEEWLNRYCADHPLDAFVTAVIRLKLELELEGRQKSN